VIAVWAKSALVPIVTPVLKHPFNTQDLPMFPLFTRPFSLVNLRSSRWVQLGLLGLAAGSSMGAAQAEAIGYATGHNLSFVLCRNGTDAIQYSQTKSNNTWVSFSAWGVAQNWTAGYRDDNSVHLNSANGTRQVQIDLFLQTCTQVSSTKGVTKVLSVDTMATTAPRISN
jgi:hypothetical protein